MISKNWFFLAVNRVKVIGLKGFVSDGPSHRISIFDMSFCSWNGFVWMATMCVNGTILWLVKLRRIQVPSQTALTVKVQWPSHSLQWDLVKNELFDNGQESMEVDNVCISRLHGWVLQGIQSWWMGLPLVWKWKSRYHCLHPSEQRSQEFRVSSLFPWHCH